jgi:4-hydroxy-tetrahydrodipicolinate reductase
MKPIVLVGCFGKMSKVLQSLCQERNLPYRLWSEKAPVELRVSDFKNVEGVVDFSLPEATDQVSKLAHEARVPYVCGTTGFRSRPEILSHFQKLAREIPIVFDSNFSLGVEILCKTAETLAQNSPTEIALTDIHHSQKKDAPSGTALKIRDRMLMKSPSAKVQIHSIRVGEIFGEHRLLVSFQDQTLEFVHRANSRRPFASGALDALKWAARQKPGLYSMEDVLK